MKPMTFCLTFDDGLKTQARVAAPLLEKFGWHGLFSVPTQIVTAGKVTPEQAEDMCLVGNEGNVMSWDDVKGLMARGHTLCPHTATHADLLALEEAGRLDEVEREIVASKREFAERTGVTPAFFCLPHCSDSPEVAALVRRHGMEPVNGAGKWRVNFGEYAPGGESYADITAFLRRFYYFGLAHIDIVIHGVTRKEGGWRPFEDAAAFERFLSAIRDEEAAGRVKVVDYGRARRTPAQPMLRSLYFKFYRHLVRIEVPEV